MPTTRTATASPWKPLQVKVFFWLWLASIASNIGTWMHEVGSGWLMTSLSASPQAVALVQVAGALPVFLLALPAGALADIVNKRRYLLAVQLWMAGVALVLTLLTLSGQMTVPLLLLLTFAMGIGSALMMPAWSALAPEIVPREDVPAAVALSSLAMNVARAIGPAIAGVLVSLSGPWLTFALNSVSFLAVIIALYAWRHQPLPSVLPAERWLGAMRAGVRYAHGSRPLRAVLVRTAAFFVGAVSGMALLPLLVRREIGGSALDYGILLGCVGAGAILGAMLLPRLRARFDPDRIVMAASLLYAVVLLGLAGIRSIAGLAPVMLLSGVAWIAVLSSLQVAVQTSVASWVRARAVSLYILVFFGCSAGGAAAWGAVASHGSMAMAFSGGALVLVLGLVLRWRFPLPVTHMDDLQPSLHWPAPVLDEQMSAERGPVMITVEYCIAAEHAAAFHKAMQAVSRMRRRNGAFSWGLMQDSENPRCWKEYFFEESWLEHLRHHDRVTRADQKLEAAARRYQDKDVAVKIRHLLAARE
ncbi:MFS transporter [Pseudomonas sp. DTU_2021_1001937_2_SI_NGA_ILE_001]|uniref:MFS transporter n=1 Tax=Pseudomonas sp. DTU_2021_1001937_2_SI_NGA_ILE_001 TaxID=3077589 RepID=UPI0028FC24C8|nr:MFS transporter [Pseudomonas sp. DTU_2021_1001937_2_SI_NGA_ILE_001]WNW12911.1 MFS transporter [Pseudomonas sp. DTU_2021_1001937_2_SI_NGA_ILE_001]